MDSGCPSARSRIVRKLKGYDMYDAQLEMSFGSRAGRLTRRQRRLTRAQWWFRHMREIVDRAIEWQPAPRPRPEQTWFPGLHRQPLLPASAPSRPSQEVEPEQEMCA